MPSLIKLFIGACIVVYAWSETNVEDYEKERAKIIRKEATLSVGGDITLTDNEKEVNNCLMQYKFYETDQGFADPDKFNFSRHFFKYKDYISKSRVYQIIKDMPKGAVLHVHDMGILNADYLLNLTYLDDLYVCFEKRKMKLKFSSTEPIEDCNSIWLQMGQARDAAKNVRKFDAKLRRHFSLEVENPEDVYPTIRESWEAFISYFVTIAPLLGHKPVWEQYCYDALQEFRSNNVMYVEIRTVLPKLYELNGTEYEQIFTAKVYEECINRFKNDYPDFIGAKIIYAPGRDINKSELDDLLKLAKQVKKETPEIFAGFDLTGQEDTGKPLIDFIPQLLSAGKELDYFFHAGETDWYGTTTDQNLIDAILLGAKRLGHAYAITKHPVLLQRARELDIALEVNVISNTVLSLVRDARNHPLGALLAAGAPLLLSSDDPGAWGADALADDFYVAFVAVASRAADLRLLKQLALNSLKYSALTAGHRSRAFGDFDAQWNTFIDNFNCSKYKYFKDVE